MEVGDSPLPPSVSELTLLNDLAGIKRVVETQVAALKASKLQKFLGEVVTAFRRVELEEVRVVLNHEDLQAVFKASESSSLDIFDSL